MFLSSTIIFMLVAILFTHEFLTEKDPPISMQRRWQHYFLFLLGFAILATVFYGALKLVPKLGSWKINYTLNIVVQLLFFIPAVKNYYSDKKKRLNR